MDKKEKDFPYLRYLPCQAEPGLFHDQYLVHVEGLDPSQPGLPIKVQLFVDRDDVKGLKGTPAPKQPVQGLLRVALVNTEEGIALVVLPQPAVPVGERMFVKAGILKKDI